MTVRTLVGSFAAVLAALFGSAAAPAQNFDTVQVRTVPVAEGVYRLMAAGGNIGVSAGPTGVFLVDDQYGPLTDKVRTAISALSNGANGVVQIFTKRGNSLAEGQLRVSMRTEAGVSSMPRRMQFSKSHYFEIDEPTATCASKNPTWTVDPVGGYCLTATGSRNAETAGISDNPFKVNYDHWDALVNPGPFATEYISIGQRRGTSNFSASFQNTRNEGVIFGLGGYTRRNARINLDQQL